MFFFILFFHFLYRVLEDLLFFCWENIQSKFPSKFFISSKAVPKPEAWPFDSSMTPAFSAGMFRAGGVVKLISKDWNDNVSPAVLTGQLPWTRCLSVFTVWQTVKCYHLLTLLKAFHCLTSLCCQQQKTHTRI